MESERETRRCGGRQEAAGEGDNDENNVLAVLRCGDSCRGRRGWAVASKREPGEQFPASHGVGGTGENETRREDCSFSSSHGAVEAPWQQMETRGIGVLVPVALWWFSVSCSLGFSLSSPRVSFWVGWGWITNTRGFRGPVLRCPASVRARTVLDSAVEQHTRGVME